MNIDEDSDSRVDIEETWLPVVGFEELYQVSNKGNVRSLDRITSGPHLTGMKISGRMLKLQTDKKGYVIVKLYKLGVYSQKRVHRLVAEAFIPNPKNLEQVNHKDANKTNNCVENLEWITNTENMRHAFKNGCFETTDRQRECARSKQELTCVARRRCVAICVPESSEILCVFRSIADAERITGINASKITAVCKGGRNRAGGYMWKYLEDIL